MKEEPKESFWYFNNLVKSSMHEATANFRKVVGNKSKINYVIPTAWANSKTYEMNLHAKNLHAS